METSLYSPYLLFLISQRKESEVQPKKIGKRIVLAHSCRQSIGQICTCLFDSNMIKKNIYFKFDSLYG